MGFAKVGSTSTNPGLSLKAEEKRVSGHLVGDWRGREADAGAGVVLGLKKFLS
jgi:hypothetical protein